MTSLEAMAQAHWQANAADSDFLPQWDELTNPSRDALLGQMRAALIALRDCGVTEGMYEAWVNMDLACDEPDGRRECANEFRAMLDAALGEG